MPSQTNNFPVIDSKFMRRMTAEIKSLTKEINSIMKTISPKKPRTRSSTKKSAKSK